MKARIIDAFHPDFMKTYYPNFTKEFRTIAANQIEREANKEKRRPAIRRVVRKKPTPILTKYEQSKTIAEIRVELDAKRAAALAVKEFFTYAKAGVGNVKPRGKKP
jgi:hypothetical protein